MPKIITTPIPKNEAARLKNICQYQIIDTPAEKAYDDITRAAASICNTPIAIISLVDTNRHWFKSIVGLEATEIPRELAFCSYTILQKEIFIVPDSAKDERFTHSSLVTCEPPIRFYAGVPLITSQNYALGSLSALDYIPRELEVSQIEALKALARQVVTLIELRRDLSKLDHAFKGQQPDKKRQPFLQKVAVGLGLASTILASAGFLSHPSLNDTVKNTDGQIKNYKIIDTLEDMNLQLQRAAIAKYRYINSPQIQYLQPYYNAKESLKQEVRQLKSQIADNPAQKERLAILEPLINQELIEVENAINLRQQGFDVTTQSLITAQGKYISDRLDATIQEMEAAENQLLQTNSRSPKAITNNFAVVFSTGILLNYFVLAIVCYFIKREINERQQVEIDLKQERDFTFAILDTIASLVVVCDAKGKIVRFNRAAEQTTGYGSDEVKGKYLWELFLPSQEVSIVKKAMELQSVHADNYETHWITRSGDRRLIAWSNTSMRDKTGAVEYVIASGSDITERAEAAIALQESQLQYHDLFENASDLIQSVALDGHFIYVNRAWRTTLGYSEAEISHLSLFDIIPNSQAHCQEVVRRVLNGENIDAVGQAEFVTKDGNSILVEGSASCKFVDGKPVAIQSIFRDITERKQTEVQLQQTNECLSRSIKELEQRNHEITLLSEISDVLQACRTIEEAYTAISTFLKLMFPDLPGGIFLINASKNTVEAVVTWGALPMPSHTFFLPNECWALRRGRSHFAGASYGDQLQCQHLEHPLPAASLCVPMIAQGEALGMLYLSSLESGTVIEAKHQLAITVAEHISLALANIKLRQKLEEQSIRDPLTGLFNRRYMEESLDREIQRCDRLQQSLGIIMLDVDHFKRFNDIFGHEAGDSVLQELGQFLQKYVRGSDIACRYRGEEFTLILPEGSLAVTSKRAEQIRAGIKHLHLKYGHELLGQITLSLGVASFPEHGTTGQAVIRQADAALYRAKKEGRDVVRLAP